MARAKGISKAQGYLSRVYTIEYDRKGQLDAYGIEFCRWLDDQIIAGKIDCRQCVDRWASDRAIYGDGNLQNWIIEKGNSFLKDDDDLQLFDDSLLA